MCIYGMIYFIYVSYRISVTKKSNKSATVSISVLQSNQLHFVVFLTCLTHHSCSFMTMNWAGACESNYSRLSYIKGSKLWLCGAKVVTEPKSSGHKSSFHAWLARIIPRGSGLWLCFQMVSSGVNTSCTLSSSISSLAESKTAGLGITWCVAPVARLWPFSSHSHGTSHCHFWLFCACRSNSFIS